jgi:hypothetical protein
MNKLKKICRQFNNEQCGELRKVIEALAVGGVLLAILLITINMCNGELFKQSGAAASTGNKVENAPGPMINTIIKNDKVTDTITNDLSTLRTKMEGNPGSAPSNTGGGSVDDAGQGGG